MALSCVPIHMEIKSRHHLRDDEAQEILSRLRDELGVEVDAGLEDVEVDADYDLVLVDGEPLVMRLDGDIFVTVQGALDLQPTRRLVTVDEGAVEYVTNGADVMRPGIVESDQDVGEGDLVVVVEENHGKALAIGRALTAGDDMMGESGKVVENLHYVGDELWGFEP